MGSEDTIEQKVHLPLIRSIIERERGNATRAADLLVPAMQYEQTLDLFYRRAQAYLAAGEPAKATDDFKKLLGHRGSGWWQVYAPLAQLGLARANAMGETVRTAAKPTTISSPPGKTRTRISRYSAKPKPNTRNSPQPHLPPLQRQGKSNSPVFLRYSLLKESPEVWSDFCRGTGLSLQKTLSSFEARPTCVVHAITTNFNLRIRGTHTCPAASVAQIGACL